MNCISCGAPLREGAKFCESCGKPVEVVAEGQYIQVKRVVPEAEPPKCEPQQISENIWLCSDGKYRWVYEFPMLKNPTILFTVWRVLGMSFAVVAVFLILLSGGDIVTQMDSENLLIFGGVLLVILVISVVAYLILAAAYGWKYMVLFEMDEEKVEHIQMASQFEKAKALGWLTAMAGARTGNLTMIGAGINTAVKDRSVSDFSSVREVKGKRSRNTIFVNQRFMHNQIYVHDCDYDFVFGFIRSHAVNAKVIKG